MEGLLLKQETRKKSPMVLLLCSIFGAILFTIIASVILQIGLLGPTVSKIVQLVFVISGAILGMYIGEKEGAKFWLQVLSDLQNRGVKDILIACIDNLNGFKDAIESIYPQTDVQLCVIHQIRNSFKYLVRSDKAEFIEDLKTIYQAINIDQAERNLDKLDQKWGKKYPVIIRSWRRNWEGLSAFFYYPKELRKIMYTTNIIESFHSQLRKITKSKRVFPNDQALLKLLYLITQKVSEKWSMPIANWKAAYSQLAIIYEDRIE